MEFCEVIVLFHADHALDLIEQLWFNIVQALLNIPENLAMKVVMDSCESGDQCERELTK